MADLWRTRARRIVQTRLRDGLRTSGDSRPHYVVCGDDALTFHLVAELLGNESSGGPPRVTVIVPYRRRADVLDLRKLRGIRLFRADRLDEETFRAAGLAGARGLALLHQDDVGNIHAALCAQEVEPNLRLVMRMFNSRLGSRVQRLFPDCAVLSDASMAAPAFVAAALGEVAPTNLRLGGRTLVVARRGEVAPEHVVCGLADTRDPHLARVLPADESQADLVLADAAGLPAGTEEETRRIVRARRLRRTFLMVRRAIRSFATRKIGIATISLLVVVVVLGFLLAKVDKTNNFGDAIYVTLVTTLVGADPETDKEPLAKVMQVVLNLAGLALIPLITAAVVDGIVNARLALHAGRIQTDRSGHVVVVGLGNVGTRVMRRLNDLGIEVVAIDKNPEARGVPVARRLGIPLIIGDVTQEETLENASLGTCRALVVVSTDDVANLQAALNAQEVNPDVRVVLRLFDGDFAARLQKAFNIGISRSVSYLAAPAFAAALLHRSVLATIPVDRHVLLVAEVPVAAGSELAGREVREVSRPESVRVIGLIRAGQPRMEWSPAADRLVGVNDRLVVVVRRAGLSRLLRQASAPPPAPPTTPEASGTGSRESWTARRGSRPGDPSAI